MLVDLEFSEKWENRSLPFETFDTSNGGLRVVFSFNGETHELVCAIKDPDHIGIYGGFNFEYTIRDYSNYNPIHPWKKAQDACAKMMESSSPEEKEKFRTIWLENYYPTYGLADDIDQILEWGKKFIDSSDPYVIAIYLLDSDCFEKNGEYIGTENLWEKEEALFFEFFRLEKKC